MEVREGIGSRYVSVTGAYVREPVLTFAQFSNNLRRMRNRTFLMILAAALPALAELQTGPPLPYHVVRDWAQLPEAWPEE